MVIWLWSIVPIVFEIIDKMRAHNLIPKRIQFVYPKANQAANILLIDAIKDGKAGEKFFFRL